jgi:hypothetical protein
LYIIFLKRIKKTIIAKAAIIEPISIPNTPFSQTCFTVLEKFSNLSKKTDSFIIFVHEILGKYFNF